MTEWVEAKDLKGLLKNPQKIPHNKTWSELCQRIFDSKLEAERGEYLRMMEMAGEIKRLVYQPKWTLSQKPKLTYAADFFYCQGGRGIFEDCKGYLTRDSRTRILWAQAKLEIQVRLVTRVKGEWQWRTL